MKTKLFTRLTGLAFAQTSTQAMLFLLSAATIWLSAPAAFAADETCASCGQEVSVSGKFAHSKYDASVTIEGAGNNAAAFHEEIYGENFTVTIAHLPVGKYTLSIAEAETWAGAPGAGGAG
jgi:hypothetical protein